MPLPAPSSASSEPHRRGLSRRSLRAAPYTHPECPPCADVKTPAANGWGGPSSRSASTDVGMLTSAEREVALGRYVVLRRRSALTWASSAPGGQPQSQAVAYVLRDCTESRTSVHGKRKRCTHLRIVVGEKGSI